MCDIIKIKNLIQVIKVLLILQISIIVVECKTSITDCSGVNCVCDISALLNEWKGFVETLSKDQLLTQINSYRCSRVKNLPKSIQIYKSKEKEGKSSKHSIMKRETKRFKRQVAFPATDEAFEHAVGNFKGAKGEKFVLRGDEVKLPCFSKINNGELPSDGREFEWTFADGQPITSSQTTEDEERGTLIFHAVELKDTGKYNCKVIYDYGSSILDFPHQLSVVSLPVFWLEILGSYESSECKRNQIEWLEGEFSTYIKYIVCPEACEIIELSFTCSGDKDSDEEDETIKKYEMFLSISSGNLEKAIETDGKRNCGIKCLETLHTKFLQIILESMNKFLARQIVITLGTEQTIKKPIPDDYDVALMEGCTAGFFLDENLCFPCEEGTFSHTGHSTCVSCARGTYQENPGSSDCKLCDSDESTMKVKSKSKSDCEPKGLVSLRLFGRKNKAMLIILLVIFLIILLILIVLSCCCYKTKIGRFLNKYLFCWCGCLCCFQSNELETIRHSDHDYKALKKKSTNEKLKVKDKVESKAVVNERSPFLPKESGLVRAKEQIISDIKHHRGRVKSTETEKFVISDFDQTDSENYETYDVKPMRSFMFPKASKLGVPEKKPTPKIIIGNSGSLGSEGDGEVCALPPRKLKNNKPKNSPPPPPPPPPH